MRWTIAASAMAACMALSACQAGLSRALQYPTDQADSKVMVGDRIYMVSFHRSDETVAIRRGLPGMFTQLTPEPAPYWRAAAQRLLDEVGCEVADLYGLHGGNSFTWEARYRCPDGARVPIETINSSAPLWRQGLEAPDPLARPSPD